MLSVQEKRWNAEEKYMLTLSQAYISRPTKIFGIEPYSDDIGYTTISYKPSIVAMIYVARLHQYMVSMSDEEKSFFRLGVYTHEALHQIFTDFNKTTIMMNSLEDGKRRLFAEVSNIVEDPRIEYFASQKFGGECLSALRFVIKEIYERSPGIGTEKDPVSQLLNALIQLGDLGLVKGEFTFPEAFNCFKKVVPYFEKAITEPICSDALNYSLKITEIIANDFPNYVKEMSEVQKRSSAPKGSGNGTDAKDNVDENGSRKPTRISKELLDKLGIDLDDFEEPPKSCLPEKSDEDFENEFELADDEPINDGGDFFDDLDAPSSDETSKSPTKEEKEDLCEVNKKICEITDSTEKDKESFDLDISSLSEIVSSIITASDKEDEKNKSDCSENISDVILNDRFTSKIVNIKMPPNPTAYSDLVENNKQMIQATKGYIKRILMNKSEEKLRHTTGTVNLNRYFDRSYSSVRVFDKKKANEIGDICIMLLADESGSTYGSKISAIRDSVTIIAEACAAFNIPCYIMGFSADEQGFDTEAEIRHYTTWKNKKSDRSSIADIKARDNNRDGASIRYATSLIKKRRESTKLLFVLSDGLPLAKGYIGEPAKLDTQLAIREAKKECSVTGILVGKSDVNDIHQMYGNDFLLVKNASELPAQLAKIFRNCF